VEAIKGAFFEALVVVMLAGLALEGRKRRDFDPRQAGDGSGFARLRLRFWTERPYFVPALAYLAACGLASLLSGDPRGSFWGTTTGQGLLLLTCLVVFFLLIAETVRSVEQAERLVSGLLIGSLPVALYGWIQYFGLDPLTWQTGSFFPVHATAGYSLYLGAYLAMVVPFSQARLFAGPAAGALKRNFPYLVILALQAGCLLFTFSRAALLAALAGCGVFSAFAIPRQQRRLFAGVGLTLLVLGSLLFLGLSYGWQIAPPNRQGEAPPVGQAASPGGQAVAPPGGQEAAPVPDVFSLRQLSNADRLAVWRRSLPIIAARPLAGYGPDRYPAVYASFYPAPAGEAAQLSTHWDPHNLVLAQLTTAGLLGLLAFGWLVFTFYRGAVHRARHSEQGAARLLAAALLASATAYLVQTQFNPSGLVALVIFWLVLGIGCGLK
jgi:O-antigen ligase